MAEEGSSGAAVEILREEYVRPEKETPSHSIWLSNLDLPANVRCYSPLLYFYPCRRPGPGSGPFFEARTLRSSLARALVPFYPFAGELRRDAGGRPVVLCTAKGVRFAEAACDRAMDWFGDFTPSPLLARLFFPAAIASVDPPCDLVLVQMTRFLCGGVSLGIAVHHYLADGPPVLRFVNGWAGIARGSNPAIAALHLDRSLLKARSPPSIHFQHRDYDYCQQSTNPQPEPTRPTTTSMLLLTEPQVRRLKAGGLTTFSAVFAHAWRSLCKATRLPAPQPTRLYVFVDVRKLLLPPLPANFLGNALVTIKLEADAGEVAGGTVGGVGAMIKRVKARSTDGYLRSLIDFLEVEEERKVKGRRQLRRGDYMAVSWLNLPFYDADFGWGPPACVNRASVAPNVIYIRRNVGEGGGVFVQLTLEEDDMVEFKRIFYQDLESRSKI